MMRQQTTFFARMGDLGGGADAAQQLLRLVMTTITMRGRRSRMTTAVKSWEEKEGEGSAKIRSAIITTIGTREEGRTS